MLLTAFVQNSTDFVHVIIKKFFAVHESLRIQFRELPKFSGILRIPEFGNSRNSCSGILQSFRILPRNEVEVCAKKNINQLTGEIFVKLKATRVHATWAVT
jgi:hypothetical protein